MGLFLAPERPVDDLSNSLKVSGADTVISAGTKGAGVRVAVWEPGPDSTSNLTISGFFDTAQSATSTHARMTNGIIKNKESGKPKGYAPSCTLFSANSYDRAALDWAVGQQNCTVISQSFHDDAEQTSDSLSFMDVYKDWLALRPPYPTIVMASGNGTSTEYVNHKSFNTVTVGSHDDTAAAMAGEPCFATRRRLTLTASFLKYAPMARAFLSSDCLTAARVSQRPRLPVPSRWCKASIPYCKSGPGLPRNPPRRRRQEHHRVDLVEGGVDGY